MKNKILSILAVIFLLVLSFGIISCDDTDYTSIETQGLLYEDGIYKLTVSSSQKEFDILSKIKISDEAEYEFSRDNEFSGSTQSGNVTLIGGDNYVYLRVTDDNDHVRVYTFNIYKKKTVTVTFNPGEGVMNNQTVSVEEGTVITAPTATRAGYTLKWDYDFVNPITQDLTINAIWTPYDCVITTNVDGVKTEYHVQYNTVPSEIVNPTKKGYKFVNWDYKNTKFDTTLPLSVDLEQFEIIAVFEPIVYHIQYIFSSEYVSNNPDNPASFTVHTEDGSVFNFSLLAPSHTSGNYVFDGWYADQGLTNKIEALTVDVVDLIDEKLTVTLYPKWKIVSNVQYDANQGEVEKTTDAFEVGKEYVLPVPQRDNYVFDGWYNGQVKVNNNGVWRYETDVELVANWIPRQSQIEYVTNVKVTENNNPNSYDVEDGEVELVAPVADGNVEFAGWYTSAQFTEETKVTHLTIDVVGEGITLYAKWIYFSNVTFDVNGGDNEIDGKTIAYGEDYKLDEPVKAKYRFLGWYYNGSLVNSEGKWHYDGDVELVAEWVPEEFKITYELNGGTNNSANLDRYTVETDPTLLVLLNPEKKNCTFLGWYLDAEYSERIESIDPTAYEGITVFAKWEEIKVVFNYNPNEGSVSAPKTEFNLGESFVLLTPTRSGYKFNGWYVGEELITDDSPWTDGTRLVLDLVASWIVEEYEITYELDGGSVGTATLKYTYTVETEDFKLPIPTKLNYYFVGWSLNGGSANMSVVVTKGSTGHRAYTAVWGSYKDEATGLIFTMVDDKMIVVGLERTIDDKIKQGIVIPSQYNGKDVVAIESNAFKSFGEKFVQTPYANMSNSYVTIYLPATIKRIGANAFEGCNGIKVSLNYPSDQYYYKTWDKTVIWEEGTISVRDCIWNFRPAIGWTRYSEAPIPDDYE